MRLLAVVLGVLVCRSCACIEWPGIGYVFVYRSGLLSGERCERIGKSDRVKSSCRGVSARGNGGVVVDLLVFTLASSQSQVRMFFLSISRKGYRSGLKRP